MKDIRKPFEEEFTENTPIGRYWNMGAYLRATTSAERRYWAIIDYYERGFSIDRIRSKTGESAETIRRTIAEYRDGAE